MRKTLTTGWENVVRSASPRLCRLYRERDVDGLKALTVDHLRSTLTAIESRPTTSS
ncbi:hypothetical protein [Serinicoccus chungangensis]|nr:hypothetical protein [Serinicoccus chungangensis]